MRSDRTLARQGLMMNYKFTPIYNQIIQYYKEIENRHNKYKLYRRNLNKRKIGLQF